MPLPLDRGHLSTEQAHPGAADLDALDTRSCIERLVVDNERATDAVRRAAPALAALVDAIVPRFEAGGRLVYLGAGTSGRLGVLDASECPPTFGSDPSRIVGLIAGGDAALRRSSEGREDDPDDGAAALGAIAPGPNDAVIGIAAGGTTPWVLGALAAARRAGAVTALLTCAPEAPRAEVDHAIVLDTGAELVAGSTRLKAGSATKLALNAISTSLFVALGKVYGHRMVDLRATNAKLTDRALRILVDLHPALSRRDAAALLDAADRDVKTAIVMAGLDVSAAEARRRLQDAGGRLRPLLGPPPR